jgi:hypothetical protein
VWSKTGGSKTVYLFNGKVRNCVKWRRQNESITVRGKQTLRAIDVFLMRAPDMKVKL